VIGEDQLQDYVRRSGRSEEDVRRTLGSVLGWGHRTGRTDGLARRRCGCFCGPL